MAKIFRVAQTRRKNRLLNRLGELKRLPNSSALVRFLARKHHLQFPAEVSTAELARVVRQHYPELAGRSDAETLLNFARDKMTRLDAKHKE